MHRLSFLSTANGPVVIAHVEPQQLADDARAKHLRKELQRCFDLPVVLRCRLGSAVSLNGDEYLYRYAISPEVDTLPVFQVLRAA